MPRLQTKNYVKRNVIGPELQALLKEYQAGTRIIQSNLKVAAGHEYWWFLEYGTGPYHRPDKELNQPSAITGTPAGGPYQISVKPQNQNKVWKYERDTKKGVVIIEIPFRLSYVTKAGERRFAFTVLHPGIKPTSFVRTTLFEGMQMLEERLNDLEDTLPKRSELVKLVNEVMGDVLTLLIAATPDDQDQDEFHEHRPHTPTLAESWRIVQAK